MSCMMKNLAASPKKEAMFVAVGELLQEGININDLTVSAITKKAGIGKGTAYEYFSTKEDLLSDAILYIRGKAIGALFEQIFERKTLKQRTEYILQVVEQEIRKKNGCINFYSLLSGNVAVSEVIREKLKKCAKENNPSVMLEQLVKRGMDEGLVRNDVPAKLLGYQSLARIMSYVTYLNMEPDAPAEESMQMKNYICDKMIEDLQVTTK